MTLAGPLPASVPDAVPRILERWRRARRAVLGDLRPFGDLPAVDPAPAHAAARALAAVIEEATAAGFIVRDPDAGWVDLTLPDLPPGLVACWREGEPMVAHSHALGHRCSTREPR